MVTWHPHRHNASHRRLRTYGGKETAVAQGPRVVRLGTPGRTGASEDQRFRDRHGDPCLAQSLAGLPAHGSPPVGGANEAAERSVAVSLFHEPAAERRTLVSPLQVFHGSDPQLARRIHSQVCSMDASRRCYAAEAGKIALLQGFPLVGETGFEPATARPPAGCATRLRHSPWLFLQSGRRESNPPYELGRLGCSHNTSPAWLVCQC